MKVTVRSRIVIRCASTSSLVQDRAVRLQELRPCIAARIRRSERFQKSRSPANTHSLLQTGRIQPELMAKFTSGSNLNLLRIRGEMVMALKVRALSYLGCALALELTPDCFTGKIILRGHGATTRSLPAVAALPICLMIICMLLKIWWPGTEFNRRRQPFQGCILPAHLAYWSIT